MYLIEIDWYKSHSRSIFGAAVTGVEILLDEKKIPYNYDLFCELIEWVRQKLNPKIPHHKLIFLIYLKDFSIWLQKN